MLEAVVFDVEGTLLDSLELRALAWRDALREFGTQVEPAELVPYVAGPRRAVARRFMDPAVLAEVTAEAVLARYDDSWENVHTEKVTAFPEAKALVMDLKERGLEIALATRAHPDRVADVVAEAGLTGMVEASGIPMPGSHTVKEGKPSEGPTDEDPGLTSTDPLDATEEDILDAAAGLVGAVNENTLAVVHGKSDAIAARKLGMRVVGLLSGGQSRQELLDGGAEHIFASRRGDAREPRRSRDPRDAHRGGRGPPPPEHRIRPVELRLSARNPSPPGGRCPLKGADGATARVSCPGEISASPSAFGDFPRRGKS